MSPSDDAPELPPGRRRYAVGFFHRVRDRPSISDDEANRIQEGHLANLRRLTESGEIIAAGPFEEDTDLRGVIIFSTDSADAAREVMSTDPAIVGRRLRLEFSTWWGPVGLGVDPDAAEAAAELERLDGG